MMRKTVAFLSGLGAVMVMSCAAQRVVGLSPEGSDGGADRVPDAGPPAPPAGGGTGGAGGIVGKGCAAETIAAVPTPVDLLLAVSKTWVEYKINDVEQSDAANAEQWKQTRQALVDFINQPKSAGLDVGLTFFPKYVTLDQRNDPKWCNLASYSELDVPFGSLPGNAGAITNLVNSTVLVKLGEPYELVIGGAIAALRTRLSANPGHKGVLILLSHYYGNPFCQALPKPPRDDYYADIARVAADGFNGTPSVSTYAIGTFWDKPVEMFGTPMLNAIAAAGGTSKATILEQGENFTANLLDTLGVIRGQALPCSFAVPKPATTALDYTKVSVRFKTATEDTEIPYAAQLARCDPARGGWYYDNQTPPSTLILCPQSCQRAKSADLNKSINLVFGCPPMLIP